MDFNRLTRRRLLYGTAGLAAVTVAGCVGAPGAASQAISADDQPGHGDEPHGHEGVSGPSDTAEVRVNTARFEGSAEFHFDPHVTWVNVGGTVTWRLDSGTHTATAYHPDNGQPLLVPEGTEAWDSGTMSEVGETYEYTFGTEGVYHYLCKPHEQFGMLATVIVGNPHVDDEVALQTIPENKPEEVRGKLEELNSMVREALEDDHEEDGAHPDDEHYDDVHEEGDSHPEEEHADDVHEESDSHPDDEHYDDVHEEGDPHPEEEHADDVHEEGAHPGEEH